MWKNIYIVTNVPSSRFFYYAVYLNYERCFFNEILILIKLWEASMKGSFTMCVSNRRLSLFQIFIVPPSKVHQVFLITE